MNYNPICFGTDLGELEDSVVDKLCKIYQNDMINNNDFGTVGIPQNIMSDN